MKQIITYISVFLLGFCSVGCEDFLTLIPESNYSAAGSYQTQTDFEQAIAAIYAEQQELYRPADSWIRTLTVRCDETRGNDGYTKGVGRFIDGDDVTQMATYWRRYWVMIYRSNMILDRIDKIDFTDANLKNYIKGEAYLLRGYSYWNLAWQFGGMPLIKQVLSAEETMKVSRSSQNETFALADEDLKNAYGLLPEEWTGANLGRATKYAAAGTLARLLLFQSKFSEAKSYLSAIISSGNYEMETDYRMCFSDAGDNGPERVWDIQFTGGQLGEGFEYPTGLLPETAVQDLMPFPGLSTAQQVSELFVAKYEDGDLRKDMSVINNLMVSGIPDNTYRIIKFICYDIYTPKDRYDWANNYPVIRYTDIKMMYAEVLNEESYVADGEAFDILNKVRKRAGLAPLTSVELPDQASFKEALIKERHMEFAFEGLRWPDLLRWGIAKQVMDDFLMDPTEGSGLYSMDSFRTIFAIPADELSRYNDPSIMWQNPGY